MSFEIVVASGNPGKVKEISEIFAGMPVVLKTKDDVGGWDDIEETGETYLENAFLKARAVCEKTGLPALADDSGIEVDAIDGAPGVHSARFAGDGATDEENNEKLVSLLEGLGPDERGARYRCVAVIAFPVGEELAAIGACEGRIALQPKGEGGFGYDPWFVPQGGSRTMAELTAEEKHAISHRGKALRGLASALQARLTGTSS